MEHHGAGGLAWAALIEHSALGETLRGSTWLYPAVECLHIVGFALLVGAIASFLAIAAVMWFTRRIDWYGLTDAPSPAPRARPVDFGAS